MKVLFLPSSQITKTFAIVMCWLTLLSVAGTVVVVQGNPSFLLAPAKPHQRSSVPTASDFLSQQPRDLQQRYPDYSCNVQADTTCPFKKNQICDSRLSGVVMDERCADGDCEGKTSEYCTCIDRIIYPKPFARLNLEYHDKSY